jgi:hypothetical protein
MVKRSVFLALGFVGVLPTLGQLSKLPACAVSGSGYPEPGTLSFTAHVQYS